MSTDTVTCTRNCSEACGPCVNEIESRRINPGRMSEQECADLADREIERRMNPNG